MSITTISCVRHYFIPSILLTYTTGWTLIILTEVLGFIFHKNVVLCCIIIVCVNRIIITNVTSVTKWFDLCRLSSVILNVRKSDTGKLPKRPIYL
jgi:hypothetical protein